MTVITKKIYLDGDLTDPESIVLEDQTGTYGVRRLDTGEVVVAAGIAMTRIGAGIYKYVLEALPMQFTYEYWVKTELSGKTIYSGGEVVGYGVLNGYTLIELCDRLTPYFNDPDLRIVPPQIRVSLLNEAQRKVIPLINRHQLHILDTIKEGATLDTAGAYDLTALSSLLYHGNTCIDGVKTSNGKYATLKSYSEYRQDKTRGITYTADTPIYRIVGAKLYVEPFTAGDEITIEYKRQPAKMVLSENDNLIITCEFDNDITDILVMWAAYWGLTFYVSTEQLKDREPRAQAALAQAMQSIQEINGYSASSDSTMTQSGFGSESSGGDFTVQIVPVEV